MTYRDGTKIGPCGKHGIRQTRRTNMRWYWRDGPDLFWRAGGSRDWQTIAPSTWPRKSMALCRRVPRSYAAQDTHYNNNTEPIEYALCKRSNKHGQRVGTESRHVRRSCQTVCALSFLFPFVFFLPFLLFRIVVLVVAPNYYVDIVDIAGNGKPTAIGHVGGVRSWSSFI